MKQIVILVIIFACLVVSSYDAGKTQGKLETHREYYGVLLGMRNEQARSNRHELERIRKMVADLESKPMRFTPGIDDGVGNWAPLQSGIVKNQAVYGVSH